MIAPSPGNPADEFTAGLVVGGMQNVFTEVPDELFTTNVPACPWSCIGKTWQGWKLNWHVCPH